MAQPIEPNPRKYRLGPVAQAIEAIGSNKKLRANAKAGAFPAIVRNIKTFVYNRYVIVILEPPRLEILENGSQALHVVVSASLQGKPVFVDNPYLFVNPPILVPNPADLDEMVEDLPEAFRQMVGEAVRSVAERAR